MKEMETEEKREKREEVLVWKRKLGAKVSPRSKLAVQKAL